MTERTTINVTKDAHEAARKAKENEDHTWSDVLVWYANHVGQTGLDNQESPIQEPMQIDWEKFDEKLQSHLGEWEITVNLDQLDLDPVGMTESEVEDVVENYLKRNWEDLKRGRV